MMAIRRLASGVLATALTVVLSSCGDDEPTMMQPEPVPDVVLDVAALDFGEVDLRLGSDGPRTVAVRNAGDGTLAVASTNLTGPDAADFSVTGGGMFTLDPGATREMQIDFMPSSAGVRTASLVVTSDDPDESSVSVALAGTGAVFEYRQVDRMGIPGLNTVFNHPSGVAGFDKTAYNTAGPADDLATYQGLFEVVLGAVANPDPAGTATLLLPDELPVSLSASPSAFSTLTGRDLADDAVDVALTVVVGIEELQSDNVDSNDVPFSDQFPYLAPAN